MAAPSQKSARAWNGGHSITPIAQSQREPGAMGYKSQFVALAGFHSLYYATFDHVRRYQDRGMSAYSELQQAEFAAGGGNASTTAMKDSAESA